MIRRPPRSTQSRSSAASDVYKRQVVAVAVVIAGAAAAVAVSYFMHIPHDIATGLYAGSLTNTPALAGAMEIAERLVPGSSGNVSAGFGICLLYTSDAADDLLCVDLGGRR